MNTADMMEANSCALLGMVRDSFSPTTMTIHQPSTRLSLEQLDVRALPTGGPWYTANFNTANVSFPAEWTSYPAQGAIFTMQPTGGVQNSGVLAAARYGRAWHAMELPADYAVRAAFRADLTTPAELFLRGQNLNSERPSYYGVSMSHGGVVQLMRMHNGTATILQTVRPTRLVPDGQWVNIALRAFGPELTVQVQRLDTGHYLTAAGQWSLHGVMTMQQTDTALANPGRAGVGHPSYTNASVFVDNFVLVAPTLPSAQTFDATFRNAPNGWNVWSKHAPTPLTSTTNALAGRALALPGTSATQTRVWLQLPLPEDGRVSAAILADTLIPVQMILRGQNMATATPRYYAVSVVRGSTIKLLRVVDGVSTELATRTTKDYLSGVWLDVSLAVQGDQLQVRMQRRDTGLWLTNAGTWQTEPTTVLNARDDQVQGSGVAGIVRPASYAGVVHVDQFRISPPPPDMAPPTVAAQVKQLPTGALGTSLTDFVRLIATVQDTHPITQVQFLIDGELVARKLQSPYQHDYQTRNLANGLHTLTVRAWDSSGNVGEATTTFSTSNQASFIRPTLPRHYEHIRYATLAYNGTSLGSQELALLQNSVDVVIPNAKYLGTINNTAPNTPQLLYTNLSNLYLELLTDWLNYAERNDHDREAAFYHVTTATPFSGDSPSSLPVNWFWNVQRGPTNRTTGYQPLTYEARTTAVGDVTFGGVNESLYVGYPEHFRELNLTLSKAAGASWSGVLEYASAVDAAGQPTGWKTLTPLSDTTGQWRRTGTVTFDPPSDWQATVVSGSAARLYYVRIRTVTGNSATAPVATRLVGRDYVGAKGTTTGTIPAFDDRADTNHDGYLNQAEYAQRRPGLNARFAYESRLFYPHYGQMRFATNPSGDGVAAWAADYHVRFLNANPLADGVFVDNSGGKVPFGSVKLAETTATYASDYGAMLGAINRAIAPQWVMANTSGGGTEADRVTRQVPSILEEFALRPLASTWAQFRDMAAMVARRLALSSPSSYMVLDTLSQGGAPTDPRTRIAALAYYYLLADPDATLLMTWGGEEPASAWSRHWFDAIAYNIGKPQGSWREFATGADPANAALRYHVFQRTYDNALVLYKPLSMTAGLGSGSTGNTSATTHTLNGNYRALNADGSLGPVVNRVVLRNGEGAILVKA